MRPIPISPKRIEWDGVHIPKRSIKPYDYVYQLRKTRGEVQRLKPQLVYLINEIAWKLTELVDAGTYVNVKWVGPLSVVYWYANDDKMKVLVAGGPTTFDRTKPCPGRGFGFAVGTSTDFFFNDAPASPAVTASRDNYISVANHLEEIVAAFNTNQELIVERILEAFKSLREMVGST